MHCDLFKWSEAVNHKQKNMETQGIRISNQTREAFLNNIRAINQMAMPPMPPPPPQQFTDYVPDAIKALEEMTFESLRRRPFPRTHPKRMQLVRLCIHSNSEVELTCFLIENGYLELFQEISDGLNDRLYDLPIPIRTRIENSYLKFIEERSNETFLKDHKQRERGDSVADRIDEIIQKFPLQTATNKMLQECPKCSICQYNIKKRQHVRKTCSKCVYHRSCCDEFLIQSRTCAICRRVLITDS